MALIVLPGLIMMAMAAFLCAHASFRILNILIRLVLLPLFLLKWLLTRVVMLIVGQIIHPSSAPSFVLDLGSFAVPLLPLLAIAAIVWLLVGSTRRPAIVDIPRSSDWAARSSAAQSFPPAPSTAVPPEARRSGRTGCADRRRPAGSPPP